MTTVSEDCSAIALYGIDVSPEVVGCFYNSMVTWYEDVGYPANKVAIHGPGHSGKFVSFKHADRTIRRNGTNGITELEIYCLTENATVLGNDYILAAMCSQKYSYINVVARASVGSLCRSTFLPLARNLAECGGAEYGIGYVREHSLGPTSYSVGISQGSAYMAGDQENEEAMQISFWANAMNDHLWRRGVLRDVYPWNFLNAYQLDYDVGGISLRRWIDERSSRGALESLSSDLVLWEIDRDKVPLIRGDLQESGNIFDWRKYYG